MFSRAVDLLSALKALLASTSKLASDSSLLKVLCIACTAASMPLWIPEHVWRVPADCWISLLRIVVTDLLMIRLRTSPIPIGLIPGFLSNGISLPASSSFRRSGGMSSVHSILARSAMASASVVDRFPYTLEHMMYLQMSASTWVYRSS